MKTKVLAALVATMAVGATCAFAANPFVDVPTDSWAYNAVVELADEGIIQGVDGTHFEGNRNITRYEAAEMTAKAMAHMDKASVEQRALINKLADEFADELNSLGVRVSNLENKVGNVKLTGDARLRYKYNDATKDVKGTEDVKGTDNDSSWNFRVRVRANAQVNDRTKATLGISTNNLSFADNGTIDNKDKNSEDIYADLANVDYNFGGNNWDLLVGRYSYNLGDGGFAWQYSDSFDGAQLKYKNNHFAATAGYGKFKIGDTAGINGKLSGVKTAYGELQGFFGHRTSAGVYYNNFSGQKDFTTDDMWGAYANFGLGQKWSLLGNYEKLNNNGSNSDADVWLGKLQYGSASFAAPKSWDAWVEYVNVENNGFINGSTGSWRWNADLLQNIESWGVGVDYTFAKNAMFSVMQSFASDWKNDKDKAEDPSELTRAQFVFVF